MILRRREFIALVGCMVVPCPIAAWAQQPDFVIGYLNIGSPTSDGYLLAEFRKGLKDSGFVEGQNVAIEFRWAEGIVNRLPAQAAEIVSRRVTVIVAGGNAPALAAKAASSTIPIVFAVGADPVKSGLVAGLSRPGGNATGVSFFASELEAKRLGLLHELAPKARTVAMLRNPDNPAAATQSADIRDAARVLGLQVVIGDASKEKDLEPIFSRFAQGGAGALLVAADPLFNSKRAGVIALAARHSLPAIYEWREFAEAGGLISYGTSLTAAYHLAGVYVGRILKGERASDLPVEQSTKFELVINLKTARALGLTVPPTLLARADEVIE